MSIDIKAVGNKVKILRETSNLTQKQLADYLSVDQSMISKLEKGERRLTSAMLDDIASLFCCSVSDILSADHLYVKHAVAFRGLTLEPLDLRNLAVINKIVLNQFEMDRIAQKEEVGGDDK